MACTESKRQSPCSGVTTVASPPESRCLVWRDNLHWAEQPLEGSCSSVGEGLARHPFCPAKEGHPPLPMDSSSMWSHITSTPSKLPASPPSVNFCSLSDLIHEHSVPISFHRNALFLSCGSLSSTAAEFRHVTPPAPVQSAAERLC